MDASLIALVPTASAPIVWRAHDVDLTAERDLLAQARKQPPTRTEVTGPLRVGDPGSAAYHVPVSLKAQRVGTLSALRSRAEPFAPDEQSALARLSKLAALAWATERYQQQRAELARIEERRRLADDLHDDVAQILFGAQIALDSTLELTLHQQAVEGVVRARALVVKADEALRAVIHHLAPPPSTDLKRALGSVVVEVEEEFGLPIRLDVTDGATEHPFEVGRPVRDALLRVARESLVNAAKHAGPCRATVRLSAGRNGRIMLAVIDDGMGMIERSRPGHHGVESLRRTVRAQGGSFRIESNPSGGTKVIASFPL
jgi:signal transduction histidine kinase